MSNATNSRIKRAVLSLGVSSVLATILMASPAAYAQQQVAANDANTGGADIETVVITGRKFNPEIAPSKASLDTMQPQTLISQSYIQDSIAPTADYVTVLAIVPSLTGQDINGPGLSDGNVKNTLRGFPDGDFNMSFDGIPFGDTNGPTHHSESYFPGAVLGGADVDRGPGNAGTLGAASFGGTIYLYSQPVLDTPRIQEEGDYGSWGTWLWNNNINTGNIPVAGTDTRVLVNLLGAGSSGYLSNQSTAKQNELVKIETDIAPGWTLTLFGNQNALHQQVSDNNGATPYQIVTFGKNFALQTTDPTLPTYAAYNRQDKNTDMDYIRLKGDVTDSFKIDDQAYTYAYVNKTNTASNLIQNLTAPAVPGGPYGPLVTQGLSTKTGSTQGAGTAANPLFMVGTNLIGGPAVGGTTNKNDIGGYTKLNAYRTWGNILRTSWDFAFGSVTGQLRAGIWWEEAATERQRYYLDISQCSDFGALGGCNGFGVEHSGLYGDSSVKKGTFFNGIPGVGYIEHSGWSQYQPFMELELHPFDGLTITPGVRYVYWRHTVDALVIASGKPPSPFIQVAPLPSNATSVSPTPGSPYPTAGTTVYDATGKGAFTTTRTLPFVEVNYKIEPYWSVYAQYANGVYVPDVTAFEAAAVSSFPKPQTTTNYQFGTVYYADNFTADADIYYIDSNNTIGSITGNAGGTNGCPANDTCATNLGAAFYKGIEGEATYAFGEDEFGGWLDGLAVFTNGSLNSAKSRVAITNNSLGDAQIEAAPFWTAASGLIYKAGAWKLSLIDKATGQQYSDNPSSRPDVNGNLLGSAAYDGVSFYHLPAYNNMDFTGSYDFGNYGVGGDWQLGLGIYNVLGSRSILSLTENDSVKAGTPMPGSAALASAYALRLDSQDQYFFQPSRMVQVTLKATW